jgi:phosphoribosyl 1,2-cyclic phosphate phosphodiesterase
MPTLDLQFLGTCAYDFSPRLEGDCRDRFDKDARRSSALLVNGQYLIDCGIHTLDSLCIIGKPYHEITDLFVTHLHGDHFNRDHVAALAAGRTEPLRMWVREDANIEDIPNVTVIKMTLFQRYEVSEGLFLTGMPANHAQKTCPQHLLIEQDGRKIFYGCDGGWLLNTTYECLRNQKLSLAVFDCTVGDYVGDFRLAEHNSIPMLRLMLPSLTTIGAINSDTQVYFSHLAPSLHKPHDETVTIATEMGAHVAYDGLSVTIS